MTAAVEEVKPLNADLPSDRAAVAVPATRLFYLDYLRVFAIVAVIAHHVGQAYGPTGGWWPIQEATRAAVLGPFFTVNRSFGMSLFFMIAGYFTVMSYDKAGSREFLKSRLLRLGIPVLCFAALAAVVQVVLGDKPWPVNVLHMWFVEHLLIFSAGYALWRFICRGRPDSGQKLANPPGVVPILVFAVGLALALGVVRIWYPIDDWVYVLGFIRTAWADVPRDLAFFVIGAVAYRQQWFSRFSTRAGLAWLAVGLALAGLCYAWELWLINVVSLSDTTFAILRVIWETVLCCGMCIGLTILFRETLNVPSRVGRAMSQGQYGAYVFHPLFVLLFQFVVIGLAAPPLAKFALVTLAAVPATFLFASLVRKPLHL